MVDEDDDIPHGWTRDSYYRYLRTLDLFRGAALKLREDPSRLESTRETLNRWRSHRNHSIPQWDRWEQLLDQGLDAFIQAGLEDSERGDTLRKTAPTPGLLSQQERMAILDKWRPYIRGKRTGLPSEEDGPQEGE
jgi:hypothetical protein